MEAQRSSTAKAMLFCSPPVMALPAALPTLLPVSSNTCPCAHLAALALNVDRQDAEGRHLGPLALRRVADQLAVVQVRLQLAVRLLALQAGRVGWNKDGGFAACTRADGLGEQAKAPRAGAPAWCV